MQNNIDNKIKTSINKKTQPIENRTNEVWNRIQKRIIENDYDMENDNNNYRPYKESKKFLKVASVLVISIGILTFLSFNVKTGSGKTIADEIKRFIKPEVEEVFPAAEGIGEPKKRKLEAEKSDLDYYVYIDKNVFELEKKENRDIYYHKGYKNSDGSKSIALEISRIKDKKPSVAANEKRNELVSKLDDKEFLTSITKEYAAWDADIEHLKFNPEVLFLERNYLGQLEYTVTLEIMILNTSYYIPFLYVEYIYKCDDMEGSYELIQTYHIEEVEGENYPLIKYSIDSFRTSNQLPIENSSKPVTESKEKDLVIEYDITKFVKENTDTGYIIYKKGNEIKWPFVSVEHKKDTGVEILIDIAKSKNAGVEKFENGHYSYMSKEIADEGMGTIVTHYFEDGVGGTYVVVTENGMIDTPGYDIDLDGIAEWGKLLPK